MNASGDNLVKDFQQGNDLAFVRLYNLHKRSIYAFCLKMLGDPDAAKDSVQEVFLKMYERRSQLLNPDCFKSWLFAITRNNCISRLRNRNGREEITDDAPEEADQSLAEMYDRKEEKDLVTAAVARLKPALREVILLREYYDCSYQEIAEILGTTESVVKSRLYTARQMLYHYLKPVFLERKKI